LYLINGTSEDYVFENAILFAKLIYKNTHLEWERINKLIDENSYQNMFIIAPDNGEIRKDAIINLKAEFSRTSLVSGKRIFIIKDSHLLGVSAANSLLKFLEDPASKESIGFLLTTNLENLLPTIISRCGIINLINMDEVKLKEVLVKENKISLNDALLGLYLNKSLTACLDCIASDGFKVYKKFLEILTSCYWKKEILILELYKGIFPYLSFNSDYNIKRNIIMLWLNFYKETLIVDNLTAEDTFYNLDLLRETNKKYSLEEIYGMIQYLDGILSNQGSFGNIPLQILGFLIKYY
jgi:DNA polymerase-3 subunit delta'